MRECIMRDCQGAQSKVSEIPKAISNIAFVLSARKVRARPGAHCAMYHSIDVAEAQVFNLA